MCGGESSNGVDLIVKTADENSELDSEEESRDDITGSLIPRENLEQIRVIRWICFWSLTCREYS